MNQSDPIRVLVLSVVKHDYIARGVASHPRNVLLVSQTLTQDICPSNELRTVNAFFGCPGYRMCGRGCNGLKPTSVHSTSR